MACAKDEAAEELANWHFGVEHFLERVIRILGDNEDAPSEPIKLLEVNAATVGNAKRTFGLSGRQQTHEPKAH